MRKLFLLAFFCSTCFLISVRAQSYETWQRLVFGESTAEDAVRIVGQPKRRKTETVSIAESLDKKPTGKKVLPVLEYEKIDGWEKVALTFWDGKLFKVKFWPRNKSLIASSLPDRYSTDFVSVEGLSSKVPLSVFEGQKEPTVPQVYDTVYLMISATKDRYILASVNNGSWKAFSRQMTKKPTVELFPGFVEDIEIVSRRWEQKRIDADVRDAEKRIDS